MKTQYSPHNTYDYAERIRSRMSRRLQEVWVAARLKPYALALKAEVSWDIIGDIEKGESIPTLYLLARLSQIRN